MCIMGQNSRQKITAKEYESVFEFEFQPRLPGFGQHDVNWSGFSITHNGANSLVLKNF